MKIAFMSSFYILLIVATIALFIFSCVVTLSDGQGALFFIFTIPIMALALVLARWLSKYLASGAKLQKILRAFPARIAFSIFLFFALLFVPGARVIPNTFLSLVGQGFEVVMGKTPYAYFKYRSSFPQVLDRHLNHSTESLVDFSKLDVTFAWDKVCIFGPYTDNSKVKEVLGFDFNIEQSSEIHFSDSINSLVFLFEGKVNQVVDLRRGLVDFATQDQCYQREMASFSASVNSDNRRILSPSADVLAVPLKREQ